MVWVAVLSLLSCVTIPIQEMSDARQALHSAEDAGAVDFAPLSLARARQQLSSAEASLRSRDYTHAREAASAAKRDARQALRLSVAFNRLHTDIEEASRIGVDHGTADQQFEQALVLSGRDEAGAAALLAEAGDALDAILQRRYQQLAVDLVNTAAGYARGMNLSQKATLESARTALRNGDFPRAYRIAEGLVRELRPL
jgi:hypothetical protein